MLQGIEVKRKTKIDYFAGIVVELGRKQCIEINILLYILLEIKAKESNLSKANRRNNFI